MDFDFNQDQDMLRDSVGNVNVNAAGSVSLAIASGPLASFSAGTTTVPASSGLATFTGLKLNKAGSYTLRASFGSVQSAASW